MTPIYNARRLRREATDAERRLWAILRDRRLAGYRFRRQHPVGSYILDFACTRYLLAVEADGSQHADSSPDDRRTAFLEKEGWRVLRFWNNDILRDTHTIVLAILAALRDAETLTRSLSRAAGEGQSGDPS